MRRSITQYKSNPKIRKLLIETPYYFETLVILKLWNFIKTTNCIDFENYIYKVVITATININHKYQNFMPPAWISVDLLNVLDLVEQDLAVLYKINCNTWLERYSDTFSCFSDFQISLEIFEIEDSSDLVKHLNITRTHGIPYFYFYWSNLSSYTTRISIQFGRVAEFLWCELVVFLTRFLFPPFFCIIIANFFLLLLLLFDYIKKFFLFLFALPFKYFRRTKK